MQRLIYLPCPTSSIAKLKESFASMENYICGLERIVEIHQSLEIELVVS